MIAVHTHRSDRLVYSVQRSPPALDVTEYDVRLVRCDTVDCSRYRAVEGTSRRLLVRTARDGDGGVGGAGLMGAW